MTGFLFTLILLVFAQTDLARQRSPDNPRPLPNCVPPQKGARTAGGLAAGRLGVVKDDFPCNDDTTGGCSQVSPKLAVDGLGNFVVSWYEFREGDADAWFQRVDSAGVLVGANERLNTDVTAGWQGDPCSAMSPDGRFLFSWEDRRDIGNSDLFCQRFDSAGTRLGGNFRASDSAAAGDQSMSGAWIAPGGVALIAWDDRRNGLTGDIFAQFLDANGQPLGGNFRVNDDAVGEANQYEPDVSGDDSGRFVVTWMDGRGVNAYDWNVFCQRFDTAGNPLGANIQATRNDSVQWTPDVSCAPDGRFAVCFDDRRFGNWDVFCQRFDAAGNSLDSNFQVNDNSGNSDQYNAAIGMNRLGEFLVAWADRRNGNDDIYARLYDAEGSPTGPSFRVHEGDAGAQQGPAVAARPDGGYWVAWQDGRAGNLDIYCQRLDRNANRVGSSFRANDDRASALQRCSSIGMDSRGYLCVAWEDERNGQTDIYGCVTDAAGNPVGSNLRLNDDGPGGAAQYYAGVAGGGSRFLAAWTDMRAGTQTTDAYAQYLDGSGQPAGSNFLVNSDATDALQWYPYPAMSEDNRAVIAFMDTRNGPYQMYCRMYDPAGSPVGPEFRVQDTTAEGDYGSTAMNSSGRFVVAWMDFRGPSTGSDAYCQAYRSDGTAIGSNIRVNTDSGGAYQGYPACAIDEQGRFVVAWEDTRNHVYDVCLQWFDSTGTRMGGNERVNDNQGEGSSYSPSCAFDSQGRLAVMFNDEREVPGSPQILCQRFRPDGSRISGNRVVNQSAQFPHNYHWTVGQSIAASDAVLAFAWTDNRRHQGFDIYAKLTDWDLIGVADGPTAGPRSSDVLSSPVRRGSRLRLAHGATLYDVSGRRLFKLSPGADGRVGLDRMAPGTYFLLSRDGQSLESHKIVVE